MKIIFITWRNLKVMLHITTNYWIPELINRVGLCELYMDDPEKTVYLITAIIIIEIRIKKTGREPSN